MTTYLGDLVRFQTDVEVQNFLLWHESLYGSDGVHRLGEMIAAGGGDKHEVGHLVRGESVVRATWGHEGAAHLITGVKRDAVVRILERQFRFSFRFQLKEFDGI